jgi:hypothetical protein
MHEFPKPQDHQQDQALLQQRKHTQALLQAQHQEGDQDQGQAVLPEQGAGEHV